MLFNTPTLIKTDIFEGVMGINEYKEYQKSLSLEDRKGVVLISITEPEASTTYPETKLSEESLIYVIGYDDVLETKFWDIEEDIGNYKTLTDEQGTELKEFILKNKDKQFLIHCKAGQSRSQELLKQLNASLIITEMFMNIEHHTH